MARASAQRLLGSGCPISLPGRRPHARARGSRIFDDAGRARRSTASRLQPEGEGVHCAVRRRPRRAAPATACAPTATMRRIAGCGSIRTSCWSIPTPSRSTGPMPTIRGWPPSRGEGADTAAADAEGDRRAPLPPAAAPPSAPLFTAGRADLRAARPGLHHAAIPTFRKRSAARSARSPIRRSSSI